MFVSETPMQFLTWFVGIATLIAGVFAIGNILLITVKERTKEIGLRKAMGATNNDILVQFLSEAVVISIIGGTIGIGLVKLVTVVLSSSLATTNGINFPIDFDLLLIFYTFMICLFIGVTSGILPARTAANLHPIDALRHE